MGTSLYTLADISAAVYARLEDNSVFFIQYEVTNCINEALRCANLFTGFYQQTVPILSVSNQLIYQVPSSIIFPQRVQFESQQLDAIPVTRIGMDYINWTNYPSSIYGQVARWIPIGNSLFALHPQDSNGGGQVFVTGIAEVPLLINPTDTMVLDDEYINIVVEYCASRLPLKVGGANWAQASQLYSKSFVPAMKKLMVYRKFTFPRYFVLSGAPAAEGRIT